MYKELKNPLLGMRIKEIRQARGLTQRQFAESLGIVQGFLSGVERGNKNISSTLALALCHTYGVNREWLETGRGEKFKVVMTPTPLQLPLFGRIPQEFPHYAEEDICDFICLPQSCKASYAIFADGDFMAPTICDGDLLLVATECEIESRDIVLVNNRWGEAILRRYRVVGADVFLSPDNHAYVPFKKDHKLKVLGKVVDVWRKVRL